MNEKFKEQMGKPLNTERARELGRLSGEKRRERKEMRETAQIVLKRLLDNKIENKTTGEKVSTREALLLKAMAKGLQDGDLNAIKYVFDMAGEAAPQKMEVTGAEGTPLISSQPLTKSEMKKLFKELEEE